ncbi:MAG: hypothetical protein Q9181_006932 [Wetmoreana brouardii]
MTLISNLRKQLSKYAISPASSVKRPRYPITMIETTFIINHPIGAPLYHPFTGLSLTRPFHADLSPTYNVELNITQYVFNPSTTRMTLATPSLQIGESAPSSPMRLPKRVRYISRVLDLALPETNKSYMQQWLMLARSFERKGGEGMLPCLKETAKRVDEWDGDDRDVWVADEETSAELEVCNGT